MQVKLFILGCPGSGKSTIARRIVEHVNQCYKGWSATRFNDYDILHKMFLDDTHKEQFRRVKHGGFYVLDRSVYNTALKELEIAVCASFNASIFLQNELAIIEFARSDYIEAFKQFNPEFIQDAYFLYIEVDIDTCIQRIKERVTHQPKTADDHYVPRKAFKFYRVDTNREYMSSKFKIDYGISDHKVGIIENREQLPNIDRWLKQFIGTIPEYELSGETISEYPENSVAK